MRGDGLTPLPDYISGAEEACTASPTDWWPVPSRRMRGVAKAKSRGSDVAISAIRWTDRTEALASAEVLLEPFLIFLATNAQGCLRSRLQAFDGDFLLAFLADAKGTVVDLGDGLVDLVEERLLTST